MICRTIPWESVLDVLPTWVGGVPSILVTAAPGPQTRTSAATWLLRWRRYEVSPYLTVRTHWLAGDPAQAFHALGYYYQHPEHRNELGAAAGRNRILAGRATVLLPPAPAPAS